MKKGKVKKVDWNKYKAPKFWLPVKYEGGGCGAAALHALTKKPYKMIKKLSKDEHWGTRTMLTFLKNNKLEIIPVTLGNVVECHSVSIFGSKPKILHDNVLLLGQECFREEMTWSVIYGGRQFHSGVNDILDPLEFINYPIERAYLIWNKKWA